MQVEITYVHCGKLIEQNKWFKESYSHEYSHGVCLEVFRRVNDYKKEQVAETAK